MNLLQYSSELSYALNIPVYLWREDLFSASGVIEARILEYARRDAKENNKTVLCLYDRKAAISTLNIVNHLCKVGWDPFTHVVLNLESQNPLNPDFESILRQVNVSINYVADFTNKNFIEKVKDKFDADAKTISLDLEDSNYGRQSSRDIGNTLLSWIKTHGVRGTYITTYNSTCLADEIYSIVNKFEIQVVNFSDVVSSPFVINIPLVNEQDLTATKLWCDPYISLDLQSKSIDSLYSAITAYRAGRMPYVEKLIIIIGD